MVTRCNGGIPGMLATRAAVLDRERGCRRKWQTEFSNLPSSIPAG